MLLTEPVEPKFHLQSVFTHVASIYAKFIVTKESVCIRKELNSHINSTGLVWDTNMALVSLFWDTDMAALTSCENTLFFHFSPTILNLPFNHSITHFSNNTLKNPNYIKFDKIMVNQV